MKDVKMFWLPLSMLFFLTADCLVSGQSTIIKDGQLLDLKQFFNAIEMKLDQQQRTTTRLIKRQEEQNQMVSAQLNEKLDQTIASFNKTVAEQLLVINEKVDQQDKTSIQERLNITDQISRTSDQQNDVIRNLNETLAQVINHLNATLSQQQQTLRNVTDLLRQIGQVDQCYAIPKPAVQHATVDRIRHTINGIVVTFVCHLGYQFSNGLKISSTTCNGDSWTLIDSSCSKIHCPRLTIPNAEMTSYNTSFQSEINVTCLSGYQVSHKRTTTVLTCQANGTWSLSSTPVCKRQLLSPSLTHIIPGNGEIRALALLNDHLFVTRRPSNGQLEVYHTSTFQFVANITIPGAGDHLLGIAPCPPPNNCLYVSDSANNKVHTVHLSSASHSDTTMLSTTTTTSWSVGRGPHGLSVNRQHNILVAYYSNEQYIDEYTPSGSRVRRIPSNGNSFHHPVQHINDTIAITLYGPVYGVSLVSVDGRILQTYGNTTRGSTTGLMSVPAALAVDTQGYLLVADAGDNNRILLLNPTLSQGRPLPLSTNPNGPWGMWLEESNGRLYVGEWHSPYRILVYDNVFNLQSAFQP